MTEYALQHYSTKRYLALHDGLFIKTPDVQKATTWPARDVVEQAHMALGSFAGSWRIVELDRPPSPTEDT
jgi:hypothetical protein